MTISKRSAILAALCAAMLVFASSFLTYQLATDAAQEGNSTQNAALRKGCRAGNKSRSSELGQRNDLILNARARAQDPATAEEGRAALDRALHRRQQLIHSVAEPKKPRSVSYDCLKRYPK